MTTITEKLVALNNIKTELKEAIKSRGVVVEDTTPFNQYPSKIESIQPTSELEKLIEKYKPQLEEHQDMCVINNMDNTSKLGVGYLMLCSRSKTRRSSINRGPLAYVEDVLYAQTSNITDMSYSFSRCKYLKEVATFDTSNVTSMSQMFYQCSNLKTIPYFNTSNVTLMTQMFYDCSNLVSIPALDTSKVTLMDFMFYGCKDLTSVPALNMRNVHSMKNIFFKCWGLKSVDMYGMQISFSVDGTQLDAAALNKLFSNLATITTSQTIDITGTPGASTCDRSIATAKGWSVIG